MREKNGKDKALLASHGISYSSIFSSLGMSSGSSGRVDSGGRSDSGSRGSHS